jgi:hypothetical protein
MKMQILRFQLFFCVATHCFGQGFLLTAGNTYTFEFTNLDFQGSSLTGPSTRIGLELLGFSGTEALQFEAFENSSSESPIFSTNLIASVGSPDFTFAPAWQDLQGVFQIDILSGSATLQGYFVSVTTTDGDFYSSKFNAVPEPPAISLIFLGSGVLIYVRKRNKKTFSACKVGLSSTTRQRAVGIMTINRTKNFGRNSL